MMARYEPFDWYEDAPRYYDMIFDEGSAAEAAFLDRVHEKHGRPRGRRMLEPACGSGRLVVACAQRGWRVTGFDLSEPMLALGRERARAAGVSTRLFTGRMESFTVRGRFDLAHCLVSTFKYLQGEDAAAGHLRCVARALAPGGLYVLGLHLTDYGDRGRHRERWTASRDGVDVVCNIQGWPADRRERTERVRARFVIHEAGVVRRLETHWTFRTYGLGQLRRLLAAVPALEHVATYHFGLDADDPIPFDGENLDNVLVLRRRDA